MHVLYVTALNMRRGFLENVMGKIPGGVLRPIAGVLSLILLGQVMMVCTQ